MLEVYRQELLELYKQGETDPNVELFLRGGNSKPPFPTCRNCDIIGCVGDEELNLKSTGERNIPPYSFCLCRRVEKEVAEEIRNKGGIEYEYLSFR